MNANAAAIYNQLHTALNNKGVTKIDGSWLIRCANALASGESAATNADLQAYFAIIAG